MDFSTELVKIRPNLKKYAHKLCKNNTEADDLLNDTMLRILDRRTQFRYNETDSGAMRRWAFTIMHSRYVNSVRLDRLHKKYGGLYNLEDHEYEHEPEDETSTVTVLLSEVRRAIDALPEYNKQILCMVTNGASYERVAEALDIPVGTVRSRLSRTRALLREQFER